MSELAELWREVWSHRRRLAPVVATLALATLGLVLLLGFGDGFAGAMRDALGRSGDAMLRWSGGATSRAFRGQPAGRPIPLGPTDAEWLAAAPGVVGSAVESQFSSRLVAEDGERSTNATVAAVGHRWAALRGFEVAAGGRFLSAADERERRRTAVVGQRLATRLFGDRPAVGRSVLLFGAPFTVVGVLPERAMVMQYGGDDAEKLVVPWPTLQAMRGLRQVDYVLVRLADPSRARAAEADHRALLAGRHGFARDDRSAVRAMNHAATADEIRAIVLGVRAFLFAIGALGLLVAAVGVGNMTFVMVEERTREIGLRLALGATPAQIRRRQLAETAVVVACGGGLGLALATLLLAALGAVPLPPEVRGYLGTPQLSLVSFGVVLAILATCCGIAGHRPAARAAAIDPVEALRHD